MPTDFKESAREITLDAATKIAEIIQESQGRGVLVVAPFTGYCAFNAALVHLGRMFHRQKKIQQEAKKQMETCLKFLLQLKQYWGLFHSITDNLKTIYKKLADSSSQGSPISEHQEVFRMLQYGDWFLKYPHGYSVGEFEDEARGSMRGDMQSPADDGALSHRPDLQTADDFFTRLGPRIDTRQSQSLPTPIQHPQTVMHTSPPDNRSPPASAGHGQSPLSHPVPGPPPMQQSSALHAVPAPTSTPLSSKPVDRPRKIDTHKASHVRRGSMSQASPPTYGAAAGSDFVQRNTASQLASPLSARLPSIQVSPQHFTGYPASALTPQNAASSTPSPIYNHNHSQQQQQQQQQPIVSQEQQQPVSQPPYLSYDAYPGGADSSLIAALSSGLWQGFDQPMNTADVSAFQEHHHQTSSSAWFMPFNSVPPGFETGPTGLDTLGMLAASGVAGGVGAESTAIRPGVGSTSSVPPGGILSTASTYHDDTSGGQLQYQRHQPR